MRAYHWDVEASDRYRDAVSSYYEQAVYSPDSLAPNGGFRCRVRAACEASALRREGIGFYPAQGVMVGPGFALTQSGRPFRVVVVPMETGRPRDRVTVPERSEEVMAAADLAYSRRNSHMRGVTLGLRLAFGLGLDDLGDEQVPLDDGASMHLLRTYAMANLNLCSATVAGTAQSRSTRLMRLNCASHLAATLAALEPTLVISQGVGLPAAMSTFLSVTEQHGPHVVTAQLAPSHSGFGASGAFIWVQLYHPSRWWDSPAKPYFQETVIPAITQARRLVLETSD